MMKIQRFKITALKAPGYMMVVYQDDHLKSILNEFNPPLSWYQLNTLLNYISDDPAKLEGLIKGKFADKIAVEAVRKIGSEPEPFIDNYPVNKKIARFCEFYEAKTAVKYKVSASDSGKAATLKATEQEWEKLMTAYYDSKNFVFVNKWSISNVAKYWNELRVEAFGTPVKKSYPIPYDQDFFSRLTINEQREYWRVLRENGYEFEPNSARGGKWVKKNILINQ